MKNELMHARGQGAGGPAVEARLLPVRENRESAARRRGRADPDADPDAAIAVPAGLAMLRPANGTAAEVTPVCGDRPAFPGVYLEAVANGQPTGALLAVAAPGVQMEVAGRGPCRVALLHPKDLVTIGGTQSFLVTTFHRPQIGPPAANRPPRPCPVCLKPVGPGEETIVYTCACGLQIHAEPDHHNEQPLQCVTMIAACPACSRPINLTQGFSWLPEAIYA